MPRPRNGGFDLPDTTKKLIEWHPVHNCDTFAKEIGIVPRELAENARQGSFDIRPTAKERMPGAI